MKQNRKKQVKEHGRGVAITQQAYCECGCGQSDLLDVRHGQKYIKGHGGVALLKQRKYALAFVIEVKLIALGFGVLTAAKAALIAVEKDLKRARDEMSKFGYDYLRMTWG